MTITRLAFQTGARVLHISDPSGEHGTVQADTHEGQVWVSILWDDAERAFPYPSELIRPVPVLVGSCADSDGRMRAYYEDGSDSLI